MKKIRILIIGMGMITYTHAQYASIDTTVGEIGPYIQSTTDEEYRYVTKGIPNSLSNGLDIKNGYYIEYEANFSPLEYYTNTIGTYQFGFYDLIRKKDSSLAAIIVKAKSNSWGNNYWLCIPINNDALQSKYDQAVMLWDCTMRTAYMRALFEEMMNQKNVRYIIDKKQKDPKHKKTIDKLLNE